MSTLAKPKEIQEICSEDPLDLNLNKLTEQNIFYQEENPTDFVGEQSSPSNCLTLTPISWRKLTA